MPCSMSREEHSVLNTHPCAQDHPSHANLISDQVIFMPIGPFRKLFEPLQGSDKIQ